MVESKDIPDELIDVLIGGKEFDSLAELWRRHNHALCMGNECVRDSELYHTEVFLVR